MKEVEKGFSIVDSVEMSKRLKREYKISEFEIYRKHAKELQTKFGDQSLPADQLRMSTAKYLEWVLKQRFQPQLFRKHFSEEQMKKEDFCEGIIMRRIEGSLTLAQEALVGGPLHGRTWVLIRYLRPGSTGTVGDMWREYSTWITEEEADTQIY